MLYVPPISVDVRVLNLCGACEIGSGGSGSSRSMFDFGGSYTFARNGGRRRSAVLNMFVDLSGILDDIGKHHCRGHGRLPFYWARRARVGRKYRYWMTR